MTNITHTRIADGQYRFTVNIQGASYEFTARVNKDSGAWIVPGFNQADHPVLRKRQAQVAHAELANHLRRNPLYIKTNQRNARNQIIFNVNPVFG